MLSVIRNKPPTSGLTTRQRIHPSQRKLPAGKLSLGFIFALLIGACAPIPAHVPDLPPTATPTETATPTATVVWFPPTATPTLFPTIEVTPTAEFMLAGGEIILEDDFSDGENWQLSRTGASSAAIGKNELTLAISSPKGYVYSLREEPLLKDFYVEITASPNLCRGQDEYGLLLRFNSPQDFYRFSLSCDGQVRLDRLSGGAASSPQPWMVSGAVPPGAPSSSRLAVWAVGSEMRFFINNTHQFTIQDPKLPSGSLGVFARSAGENAVTINFSDLIVRQAEEGQ